MRLDLQLSISVEAYVSRAACVALDFARAPVGGAAWVAGAGVDDPVGCAGKSTPETVEVVSPGESVAVNRGDGGFDCRCAQKHAR